MKTGDCGVLNKLCTETCLPHGFVGKFCVIDQATDSGYTVRIAPNCEASHVWWVRFNAIDPINVENLTEEDLAFLVKIKLLL